MALKTLGLVKLIAYIQNAEVGLVDLPGFGLHPGPHGPETNDVDPEISDFLLAS